jgi:membrane protease YdiL (CAAX protease family)
VTGQPYDHDRRRSPAEADAGDAYGRGSLGAGAATPPDGDAAPDGSGPLPVLPPPSFCDRCGSPWNPSRLTCASCEPGPAAPAATRAVAETSVSGAMWLYFSLLGATLVGIIAARGTAARDDDGGVSAEIVITVVHTFLVLAWVAAGRTEVVPLLARPGGGRWYAAAAGLAPVTFLAATLVIAAAMRLPGMTQVRYAQPFLDAGYGWGSVVLLVCVQPAVIEELAFRGVILGALRRGLTDREALVVSTMMFAVLHLSVPSTPHLVLIGAALGWLRLRTGSLYPGMVLHFLHNGLCLVGEAYDL